MSTATSDGDWHADPYHLASTSEAEDFWERQHRSRDRVSSGHAKLLVVEVAGQLAPGTGPGMREGSDAVWRAGQGGR